MVVPCAQLRVFLPTDSLGPGDRERWAPDGALGHRAARRVEDEVARQRLLTGRGSVDEAALLSRRAGDRRYVCPLQYDVRAASGMRVLAEQLPPAVVDALLPGGALRARLEAIGAARRTPTVVDAPWAVPLAWFVCFSDRERRLLDPDEGDAPRLLHLTTVGTAIDRVERAVEAMDVVDDAADLLEDVADLAEWLEAFPTDALLELDYAGLTRLLSAEQLAADRSAHEVWKALEALEDGDLLAAVAYWGVLRGRWTALRSQQTAS